MGINMSNSADNNTNNQIENSITEHDTAEIGSTPSKKKKRRKRVIDKEKVAANKQKAKAKKKRLKNQLKEEKARIKAERRKGKVLEESVKLEESVTVNEQGAVERTITVEETYTIEEKPAEPRDVLKKKRKKLLIIAAVIVGVCALAGTGGFLEYRKYLIGQEAESNAIEAMVYADAVELAEYTTTLKKKNRLMQDAGKDIPEA